MTRYSLPPKLDEIDDQVKLSYGYKGNNRLKVQIVQFIEWHNKKHEKRNKKKKENERKNRKRKIWKKKKNKKKNRN